MQIRQMTTTILLQAMMTLVLLPTGINKLSKIQDRVTGISGEKEVNIEISKTSNQPETKIGLYVK